MLAAVFSSTFDEGGAVMRIESVEIFSDQTNTAVMRHPGRKLSDGASELANGLTTQSGYLP
jgi:hypothetical protein